MSFQENCQTPTTRYSELTFATGKLWGKAERSEACRSNFDYTTLAQIDLNVQRARDHATPTFVQLLMHW